MQLQQHFEYIRQLIRRGQTKALHLVNTEQLAIYWQIGAYVCVRLQTAEWGEKNVQELAKWLKEKEPSLKGFERRSLYRMKEFFQAWHVVDWNKLSNPQFVSTPSTQLQKIENEMTIDFPRALSSLTWSHHIELLGQTKKPEEKIFYLLLATKEQYSVRDLRRQIRSGLYERQKLSNKQLVGTTHPNAAIIPQIFRDKYIFEFLDLPDPYTETDLQKGLISRLKQFILELGKDFIFMGEQHRIQVGMQDFYLDLLFFHRDLQCLVAFELKTSGFQPEFLGKLNFYLEALDREVKKPHEKPSIGVLLCTAKDEEVVEFALSRNISPALVAEYETKLIDKGLLRRMLQEWAEHITPAA